ncbi:MAG: hypothetical protein ABIS45_07010 [Burkholderiales bacterium]
MKPQRFPIRFDSWYATLSSALLLPPSKSYIEVDDEQVCVQMGWAFRSCFPRTTVAGTAEMHKNPLSRGVHGFAGRWLVNGSGQGILTIDLTPGQRGYVMGFPIRLRQLMVSVAEPLALATALRNSA